MKARIEKDEWWPVYSLDKPDGFGGRDIEVDQALWDRWRACNDEFSELQNILRPLYKTATEAK